MNEPKLNGFLIRRLREKAGLSQLQLSYEIGCDSSVICTIESGRNINPSFLSVARFACFFNRSLDDFYVFDENKRTTPLIRPEQFSSPRQVIRCFNNIIKEKFGEQLFVFPFTIPSAPPKKAPPLPEGQLKLNLKFR